MVVLAEELAIVGPFAAQEEREEGVDEEMVAEGACHFNASVDCSAAGAAAEVGGAGHFFGEVGD